VADGTTDVLRRCLEEEELACTTSSMTMVIATAMSPPAAFAGGRAAPATSLYATEFRLTTVDVAATTLDALLARMELDVVLTTTFSTTMVTPRPESVHPA